MKIALALGALLMAAPLAANASDLDEGRVPARGSAKHAALEGVPRQLSSEERTAYLSLIHI